MDAYGNDDAVGDSDCDVNDKSGGVPGGEATQQMYYAIESESC
jgi:hypothetical protein